MYNYTIDGNVAILTMSNGENRFNIDTLKAFRKALDEIEAESQVNAMVTNSADTKVWCNGIDLDWMLPLMQKGNEAEFNTFLIEMYSLFKRLLTMPMITVASMNGHAFAGGAFLALSHDFRFMRSDRGWLCLPEVDLGIPLGPVFMAITKHNVPTYMLHDMQYTARRLTAQECEEHHLITRACSNETLLEEATAYARGLNKRRDIIKQMKKETLEPVVNTIDATIRELSKKV